MTYISGTMQNLCLYGAGAKGDGAHTFLSCTEAGHKEFLCISGRAQRGTHFCILPYSTFISNPYQQTLIQGIVNSNKNDQILNTFLCVCKLAPIFIEISSDFG